MLVFGTLALAISNHLAGNGYTLATSNYLSGNGSTENMTRTTQIRLAFLGDVGIRGTALALYDYADFSERILGLPTPLILYFEAGQVDAGTVAKHIARFGAENVIKLSKHHRSLDAALQRGGITHLHTLVGGTRGERPTSLPVRLLVHGIFTAHPEGSMIASRRKNESEVVLARVSSAVPDSCSGVPVVPHIVRQLGDQGWNLEGPNLREVLRIPANATVFCRYGGFNSFSRLMTRNGVMTAAIAQPESFFLFMNTASFTKLPNVIFLNATTDSEKPTFVRTCDAMVHGRENGEMFGLAIAEFSIMQRPIFTSGPKKRHLAARAHLDILGKKAIVHETTEQLVSQLAAFNRSWAAAQGEYWNAYADFAPEHVMQAFNCVFLQGGLCSSPAGSTAPAMGETVESCSSCKAYQHGSSCVKSTKSFG